MAAFSSINTCYNAKIISEHKSGSVLGTALALRVWRPGLAILACTTLVMTLACTWEEGWLALWTSSRTQNQVGQEGQNLSIGARGEVHFGYGNRKSWG